MPGVDIIEQFSLGANLPLDARYVVNSPYDVSLYWYDGMLIYKESTNQLFIVKDTSAERIVEILDSSSGLITSIDSSLLDLEVRVGDNEHRFREMKAPTGFADYNEDSSIYFTGNTFHLTSDTSAEYYVAGQEYILSDASLSISTAAEGFHYIYFDASGNIQSTQNNAIWENLNIAKIAVAYWDTTNQEIIWYSDQRYGTVMDVETRNYLRESFGIQYISGMLLYDFSINEIGGGTTDVEAQFSITGGELQNEDLQIDIDASDFNYAPLNCPTFYLSGPGVFRKTPIREFPVINASTASGRLAYANFNGSNWVQTEASSGNYINSHIVFINDPLNPISAFQGIAQYETIEDARVGQLDELKYVLALSSGVGSEWKTIASVIYQTSDAFSNTPLAKVVPDEIDDPFSDWRRSSIPKTTGDDHGKLTGLQFDTHRQYALLNGRNDVNDTLRIDNITALTQPANNLNFRGSQLKFIGNPIDPSSATHKYYVDLRDSIIDASIVRIDGSVNYLYSQIGTGVTQSYVDGSLAARDASITYLFDNTYTRTYIDGSLNVKADLTYVDASLNAKTSITYVDGSLALKTSFEYVDGSLSARDTSIAWIADNTYTKNYIDTAFFAYDLSIDQLYEVKLDKIDFDASISSIETELDTKTSITYVDGSLDIRDTRLDINESSIGNLYDQEFLRESSLGTDFYWNNNVVDLSTAFKNKLANSASEGYAPFYFKDGALNTNFLRNLVPQNGLITYGDGSTSVLDSSIYLPASITATGSDFQGNMTETMQYLSFVDMTIRQKVTNSTSINSGSGLTQLAAYNDPDASQGLFFNWGTHSINNSVITWNNYTVFYQGGQTSVRSSFTLDTSNLATNAYAVYFSIASGTPAVEISTSLERISYADKAFIGWFGTTDSSLFTPPGWDGTVINIYEETPDLFGTPTIHRDGEHYAPVVKDGMHLYISDTSLNKLGNTSGNQFIEGGEFKNIDFATGTFLGSQNIKEFDSSAGIRFWEFDPSTGYADIEELHTDILLYKNRYWDVSAFVDSSIAGKYTLSAVWLAFGGVAGIQRGGLFDTMIDAQEAIPIFAQTAAPINQVINKVQPLIAHLIIQTDASDVTDESQFKILNTTDFTAVTSGGGSGSGAVSGATNLAGGEGLYAGLIGTNLTFKSLVEGVGIELSASAGTITIDTSIKSYDASINQIAAESAAHDTIQDASIKTLDGSVAYLFTLPQEYTSFEYVDGSLAARDTSIEWLADNTYNKLYIDNSLNVKADLTYVDASLTARDTIINEKVDGTGSTGIHNPVAWWSATKTIDDDPLFVFDPTNNRLGIGVSEFSSADPEMLLVDAGITSSYTIARFKGQIDDYLQLEVKNDSAGPNASADIVASTSQSTEDLGYVNMGINSENYSGTFVGLARDAYLYSLSANLLIGNASTGQDIIFFTDGENAYTNERLRLTSDGKFQFGQPTSTTYDFEVNGDINIPTGDNYHINGVPLYSNSYIDSSLDNRVRITGDTMTGNLTIPGLVINNDVSIGGDLTVQGDVSLNQKIHLEPYTNTTPENGDLWRENDASGHGHLYYKHDIEDVDASSYDLVNRLLRTPNDWSKFSDSSTLDTGDRILIEDAQDGYAKKWISAEAFAAASQQLLFAAYDDAKPVQSTTSLTYVNALSLTTDASAIASTYRVGWTLQIANSKNGKQSSYRIIIDGTTILEDETVTAIAANSYASWSGFEYVTLTAGAHTIDIDYHTQSGSTTYIQYARLEYRKADVETA